MNQTLLCGHTVEISKASVWSESALSTYSLTLSIYDVQAVKDLGSVQRSVRQSLWWQLPFLRVIHRDVMSEESDSLLQKSSPFKEI